MESDPESKTMNVALSPGLVMFIKERVNSGLYSSASEVVRDALRLLVRIHSGDDEPKVYEDKLNRERVREAIAGLKRLRKGQTLGPDLSIQDLVGEGRP